jgi:hypothetical protein
MTDEKLPFPFPVDVAQLPAGGRDYAVKADQVEREAVARHLDLTALARLVADITVLPKAGGIEAKGRFEADVTQACVVTLASLPATVKGDILRYYETPRLRKSAGKRKTQEPEFPAAGWIDPDDEVPDPIIDGHIDLGALVVEELALHLDPYPRVPGATFQTAAAENTPEAAPSGPFAALADLKAAGRKAASSARRPAARDAKPRRR